MNKLAKFFHEFMNPHCTHCVEDRVCNSCDTIQKQLDIANDEKKRLLEIILDKNRVASDPVTQVNYDKVKPAHIPWNTRRALLEQEDREKAKIMRSHNKEQEQVDKLEKELGLDATRAEEG